MLRSASLWAILLASSPAALSAAGDLSVVGGACAATVSVKASEVPLESVLAALSRDLGFELHLKTSLKTPVSLDQTDSPEQLIKSLLRGHNLVLETKPRPDCKGKEGVANVWILPAGEAQVRESEGLAWNPALNPQRHPRFGRRKNNISPEEWHRLKKEWKAGRIQADPETGEPVPVDGDK